MDFPGYNTVVTFQCEQKFLEMLRRRRVFLCNCSKYARSITHLKWGYYHNILKGSMNFRYNKCLKKYTYKV